MSRAVKNITRRKTRVLLAVIAIGVAMAIMISIPAGLNADQAAVEGMTQRLNVNYSSMASAIENTSTLIQVGTAGTGGNSGYGGASGGSGFGSGGSGYQRIGSLGGSTVNETAQQGIASIDGVQTVVPYVMRTEGMPSASSFTPGEFQRGQGPNFANLLANITQVEGVNLSAEDIANYNVLPTDIISGRNLEAGETGAVLLTENLTQHFSTQLGGTVTIEGRTFTVVGIYEPTGTESNRTVYMSLPDAQSIYGLGSSVSYLDVYAENSTVVNEVANAIQAVYTDLPVSTMSDRLSQLQTEEQNNEQAMASMNATVGQTQTTGQQEMIIAVGAAGLVIMFTMLYAVRERTKEIGVLKTLGFSKGAVIAQFMLEGVFVTALAGVVGMVIGWVGTSALASVLVPASTGTTRTEFGRAAAVSLNIQPDPSWMVIAFVLVVAIGALGSLYPAWRASRTRPVEALKNE